MSDLKKVHAGDKLRIPAATFNTLIDVARDHLANRQNVNRRPETPMPPPGVILTIRNDSGSDRDRFEVLGLDEPVFPPEDNTADMSRGPVMSGVYPVDPDHVGAFVVLLEPIAAGAIGRAIIQGAVPVQVDFADTDPNTHADISDGVAANLKAMATGSAKILWRTGDPGDTGVEWCICELTGNSDRHVAVTSEDSTPGALRSTDAEVADKPHKIVGDELRLRLQRRPHGGDPLRVPSFPRPGPPPGLPVPHGRRGRPLCQYRDRAHRQGRHPALAGGGIELGRQ